MASIIGELFEKDIVKFGEFQLKSGVTSLIYVDLRSIISYPSLMVKISESIYQAASGLEFDHICGLPYTGIPFASYISTKYNKPMLIVRKERKKYGTKKLIEGHFKRGDRCILVDDVLTSGGTIEENMEILTKEGLIITGVIVFVDRRKVHTNINNIPIKNILTLKHIVDYHQSL